MAKILVRNYVKEYPDFFKVVEYSYPRYVGKDDTPKDDECMKYFEALNPNVFYRNLPKSIRKIKDLFADPEPPLIPPVVNMSFDFYHDTHSERLWSAYEQQLVRRSQSPVSSSLEASVRRSRRVIKDLVSSNPFDMWATFTFADQVYDIDLAKKRMSQWLKDQQKLHGSFDYLMVPEYHKSGAVHFHALLMGYRGEITPAISPYTQKQLTRKGKPLFNIRSYGRGFTTLEYIDSTVAVSRYITKYITKETPVMGGKRRYFHSKGLKMPVCTPNHPIAMSTNKSLYASTPMFDISYVPKVKGSLNSDSVPF